MTRSKAIRLAMCGAVAAVVGCGKADDSEFNGSVPTKETVALEIPSSAATAAHAASSSNLSVRGGRAAGRRGQGLRADRHGGRGGQWLDGGGAGPGPRHHAVPAHDRRAVTRPSGDRGTIRSARIVPADGDADRAARLHVHAGRQGEERPGQRVRDRALGHAHARRGRQRRRHEGVRQRQLHAGLRRVRHASAARQQRGEGRVPVLAHQPDGHRDHQRELHGRAGPLRSDQLPDQRADLRRGLRLQRHARAAAATCSTRTPRTTWRPPPPRRRWRSTAAGWRRAPAAPTCSSRVVMSVPPCRPPASAGTRISARSTATRRTIRRWTGALKQLRVRHGGVRVAGGSVTQPPQRPGVAGAAPGVAHDSTGVADRQRRAASGFAGGVARAVHQVRRQRVRTLRLHPGRSDEGRGRHAGRVRQGAGALGRLSQRIVAADLADPDRHPPLPQRAARRARALAPQVSARGAGAAARDTAARSCSRTGTRPASFWRSWISRRSRRPSTTSSTR